MINACCSSNTGNSSGARMQNPNKHDVQLGNNIILNQNSPNPFAEQTTIEYYLPEGSAAAKIIFYTQSGVVIKTVALESTGKGQLTVYAENLSSGIYSYSLVVDGKVIDSKKMICTK